MVHLIRQRASNDCGIACAAMLMGTSYDTMAAKLSDALTRRGIEAGLMAKTLGLEVFKFERRVTLQYVGDGIALVLKPRARKHGHYVVVSGDDVFDPSREEKATRSAYAKCRVARLLR